ncbi:TetR/AcrR family transcriptional regulator [Melioribacteraceae bacterium 4301-Me]|uniref:TetR/AcrR family transcriptional regulator n=1 Tax=Pyranulibacter aquaticus TaxID=3163344 RepID=UPI003596FD8F
MTNKISDSKKDLILQTARKLLAKNGFAKTTLEDIANALGMRKSSLYYYYANKDELLEEVMEKEQKNFCAIIEDTLKQSRSTIEKIINYEIAKFNYVKETIKMHEINTNIFLEIKSKLYEHIKEVHQAEIEMLKKILNEGIKKKEIKKCDTQKVAELISTLSEALRHREFYFSSFSVNKSIDFTNAIDEMIFAVKLIFDGLSTK